MHRWKKSRLCFVQELPLILRLNFSNIKAGSSVAVAGFGGLGMMAVKYAVKMGAKVSVFARNENKKADALAMGVSSFIQAQIKML